jgi:hypothetical protein
MTPKTFSYIAMAFLGISVIAHGYQDALPEYAKWFVDTATVATGLAALFTHPPQQGNP